MDKKKARIDVSEITQIQTDTVARWHEHEIENSYQGLLATVCQQHAFNFQLWHEEDIARCPDATDMEIARVKRSIDRLNQQRNDWIEKVDDQIHTYIENQGVFADESTPLNTETPGCAIDRLSILALRIFHLREQLQRPGVSASHVESVEHKVGVCLLQQDDLSTSLQQLLEDVFAGRKRHRTYRQLKMYNDPTLNPFLYQAKKQAV